jgi:hypothetical protein
MASKNMATISFDVGDTHPMVLLNVRNALELLAEKFTIFESLMVANTEEIVSLIDLYLFPLFRKDCVLKSMNSVNWCTRIK